VALDTASKRASSVGVLMSFVLAPPIPDGDLEAGDRQHASWSYSGVLAGAATLLAFVQDVNSRLAVYLRDFYSAPGGDLNVLLVRYHAANTGDLNARLHKAVDDATEAMT
jgi:hypothetical protein